MEPSTRQKTDLVANRVPEIADAPTRAAASADPDAASVSLRPDRTIVVAAILITAVLPTMPWSFNSPRNPHPLSPHLVVLCAAALFLVAGTVSGVFAAWQAWREVRVSADGIDWRVCRRNGHIAWSDVRDYYQRITQRGNRSSYAIVIVGADRTIELEGRWIGDVSAFRAMVVRCATNARVHEWGILGTRAVDVDGASRTFRYGGSQHRGRLIHFVLVGMASTWLCVTALWYGLCAIPRTVAEMGWLYTTSAFVLRMSVYSLYPILLCVLIGSPVADTLRRLRERIVVTPDWIEWTNGATTKSVRWADVTDCLCAKSRSAGKVLNRYVVVAGTTRIEFSSALEDCALLSNTVLQYAVNSPDRSWRDVSEADDRIGGVGSEWTSGVVGVGQPVYRYRNRNARALLVFLTFCACLPALLAALHVVTDTGAGGAGQASSTAVGWCGIALPVLAAGWLWWRYLDAWIEVRGDGLRQRLPGGFRTVHWADIVDYRGGPKAFRSTIVARDGTRVVFWFTLCRYEAFCAEVARRAPLPRKGWDGPSDRG
jgi:hypothetical protein